MLYSFVEEKTILTPVMFCLSGFEFYSVVQVGIELTACTVQADLKQYNIKSIFNATVNMVVCT